MVRSIGVARIVGTVATIVLAVLLFAASTNVEFAQSPGCLGYAISSSESDNCISGPQPGPVYPLCKDVSYTIQWSDGATTYVNTEGTGQRRAFGKTVVGLVVCGTQVQIPNAGQIS